MGIGIPLEVIQELWPQYNTYEGWDEDAEGYAWFKDLPEWAYSRTDGPFYIDETSIYTATTRPSEEGMPIGDLA